MNKIYWVGDMLSNKGPAIVNKSYCTYLKPKVTFCFTNNKILRFIHFFLFSSFKKIIIVSGFSKLNLLLLKIAKFRNKKVIYLMHGYIKNESKYIEIIDKDKKIKAEYEFLKKADKICCVSEKFCNDLKKEHLEFKDKIIFVNNGIDCLKEQNFKTFGKNYTIISVGGGLKNKNNLIICEAIDSLKNPNIKFIVIGPLGEDGIKIKKYTFVDYYESLPHEMVLEKMRNSNLYIQNSYFETFGLAIVEALNSGCDLLLSSNVGVLGVLENVKKNDLIFNNEDLKEISEKICSKMKAKSNISYDENECSWSSKSDELLKKVSDLYEK